MEMGLSGQCGLCATLVILRGSGVDVGPTICVPHLPLWICHSEGFWGRSWADDLATNTFAHISLWLNIDARPPDSLSEMLFKFSDALVPLMC